MCENQGYLNPQVHSLPNNCSGNCEKCKDHHQEKCDRAVPESAEKQIAELENELSIWRSVFPDVAPEQVQPDRSEMRDRINELELKLEELQSVLITCSNIFKSYADMHDAKGPGHADKANRNRDFAEMCDQSVNYFERKGCKNRLAKIVWDRGGEA